MDAMLASDPAFVQFVAELGAASRKLLVVMNRITYPGCAGDGTDGMITAWLVKRHRHETLNEGVRGGRWPIRPSCFTQPGVACYAVLPCASIAP